MICIQGQEFDLMIYSKLFDLKVMCSYKKGQGIWSCNNIFLQLKSRNLTSRSCNIYSYNRGQGIRPRGHAIYILTV